MLHAGMAPAALDEAGLACSHCTHDSLVFGAACFVLVDNPQRHTPAEAPTGASLGSQQRISSIPADPINVSASEYHAPAPAQSRERSP